MTLVGTYPDDVDWGAPGSDPTPAPRERGHNIDRVGRRGRHPDAPRAFGLDPKERAKYTPPLIRMPDREKRQGLLNGSVFAVLLDAEPNWAAGELVPVARLRDADGERDDPLVVEVQSLEWFEACEVDANRAAMLGYKRLGEFAKARYHGRAAGSVQAHMLRLQRDTSPVWFAVLIVSHVNGAVPFDLDDLQSNQAPRWLTAGGIGYVESEHVGVTEAGVCVSREWLKKFGAAAAPSRTLAANRRRIEHRTSDRTRQHPARRQPRKATLPRGEA